MSYSPYFRGTISIGAASSARKLQSGYQNGTLSTITKSTPVVVTTLSQLALANVSDETTINSIGLASIDIPSGATGSVADAGRLEDITTSFSVGDSIYLGKTPGTLINVKPNIGVSGFVANDFVVFLGVIVKNEFDSLKKDLKLMISVTGQL
jgi:hypothetical protein